MMTGTVPILEARAVGCSNAPSGGEPSSVRDVSLAVEAGTLNLFCGDNGSGKNLLLRLLALLDAPDAGEIFLRSEPTRGLTEDVRAALRNRHYGFLFAEPFLLPSFTVVENVAMPLFKISGVGTDEAGLRTQAALDFTGMAGFSDATIDQLTPAGQHRVSLARALANKPDILIVENVDAAMPSEDIPGFVETIRNACRKLGATAILTARGKELAGFADRVIEMAGGGICSDMLVAVKSGGMP
jgi:putative ABC transport system ATP-binding protein